MAVIGNLTVEMVTANVVTGNAALGTAGTLTEAEVLTFTISNASLFVGTGGALNANRTAVTTAGAIGFSSPAPASPWFR